MPLFKRKDKKGTPPWESRDVDTVVAYIRTCDDQDRLRQLTGHSNAFVVEAAMRRLNMDDPQSYHVLRNIACEGDERLYRDVAQSLLGEAGKTEALMHAARHGLYWNSRKAAVRRIADQAALESLAMDDEVEPVADPVQMHASPTSPAMIAVECMTDIARLRAVAVNAPDEEVRALAEKRVAQLEGERSE